MYLLNRNENDNNNVKHLCIENVLDNSVFESFVAFFRFQHLFLEPNKNYWNKLNDSFYKNIYINHNLRKASSPASCCSILQHVVTDPIFLTKIVRDKFSLIDHEIEESRILSVDTKALMLTNGSAINIHTDYPFDHKDNEIVLKMMYYAHSSWDASNWYGQLEFWKNKLITHQYDPLPNRLVVMVSNDTSYHSISPIEKMPNNAYQNVVVFYIKLSLT